MPSSEDGVPGERTVPRALSTDRRGLLKGIGAASAMSLAGCSGDGGSDDEDPVFLTMARGTPPDRINWNPYSPGGGIGEGFAPTLNHYFAHIDYENEELIPSLAVDWGIDNEISPPEGYVQIRDDFVWHNGDDVTAEDVAGQFHILNVLGRTPFQLVEDVGVEDETTVTLTLTEPRNEEAFFIPLLGGQPLNTSRAIYGDLMDAASEASTDEEREAAVGQIQDFRVSDEDAVGCSPWQIESSSDTIYEFSLFEDHPMAEEFEFDTQQREFLQGNVGRWENIFNEQYDVGLGRVTNTVLEQIPEDAYQEYVVEYNSGVGIALHSEAFPDYRVRKALSYAIDQEQVAINSGRAIPQASQPREYQVGLFGDAETVDEKVGESGFVEDNVELYGGPNADFAIDTDAAAALLEDAGYSRDGGTWYTPDDEEFSFTLNWYNLDSGTTPMMETIAEDLEDFGVSVELESSDAAAYFADLARGNFEMAMCFLGGLGWTPLHHLTYIFAPRRIGTPANKQYDLTSVEVPMPVGETDGDLTAVNVEGYLADLSSPDQDTVEEAARTLAWVVNQSVQVIEFMQSKQVYYLHEEWEGPDPEAGIANVDILHDSWLMDGHVNPS